MISCDCNKCCKADVCKYIEEKNKNLLKLEEIIDNSTILNASIYCIYFKEKPTAFR